MWFSLHIKAPLKRWHWKSEGQNKGELHYKKMDFEIMCLYRQLQCYKTINVHGFCHIHILSLWYTAVAKKTTIPESISNEIFSSAQKPDPRLFVNAFVWDLTTKFILHSFSFSLINGKPTAPVTTSKKKEDIQISTKKKELMWTYKKQPNATLKQCYFAWGSLHVWPVVSDR